MQIGRKIPLHDEFPSVRAFLFIHMARISMTTTAEPYINNNLAISLARRENENQHKKTTTKSKLI